jgi:hypothetical protein
MSWKPPRGRVGLFVLRRLAPLLISSLVSRSARVLDWPAMLRPNRRPEPVVGGA